MQICLALVLVSSLALIIWTIRLERDLEGSLKQFNLTLQSVQAIETNTTRTEAELAGLLNTTRHIAIDEHNAQAAQLRMVQELSVKAYRVLDDTDETVKQIGDIAPQITSTVRDTGINLQSTLMSSQKLLEATTDDVASPAIKLSLDNIAAATDNARITTEEAAGTMVDIHRGVSYEIKELMKPVKKVKVGILFLATLAGKFFGY